MKCDDRGSSTNSLTMSHSVNASVLVVIPARGGSKGIPRKNLRSMAGKPLIYYSITTALQSTFKPDVYVSSDDQEILSLAESIGAKTIHRAAAIAQDTTTLDPVIYDAYMKAQATENKVYDVIVTLQPTSPLLKTATLDDALRKVVVDLSIDTVIAAKDDTHLSWRREGNHYVPNYEKRVNRQYLTPCYTETGGFLITRGTVISPDNRIGRNVDLYLLSGGEEIDIDTYEDWNLCEYYLNRKKIVFVVAGTKQIGLGHVYNTLIVANDILNHQIEFLVDKDSRMAYDKIATKNYPVNQQQHANIVEDIKAQCPDVVINDRLDTHENYVKELKSLGVAVINFEDLGDGAKYADMVINAIYPEDEIMPNHYFGSKYYLLRDEFILRAPIEVKPDVRNILITFGGVDPNNYTTKVLGAIVGYCAQRNIEITVIAGFGYQAYETLEEFAGISLIRDVPNIAEYMGRADIIFTSAGRTTYEVASLGVPTIVLAQNEREMTHCFATMENGFLNLGLGTEVSEDAILNRLSHLAESLEARQYMSALMRQVDLKAGRSTVNRLIQQILVQL